MAADPKNGSNKQDQTAATVFNGSNDVGKDAIKSYTQDTTTARVAEPRVLSG